MSRFEQTEAKKTFIKIQTASDKTLSFPFVAQQNRV
jgi:hypothetical protein